MRSLTIDIAIRIGLLVLLAYWSLKVIGPFVTILLWSGFLPSLSIQFSIG